MQRVLDMLRSPSWAQEAKTRSTACQMAQHKAEKEVSPSVVEAW